jgi:very-short-patch-repair endonuclease
MTTIAELLDRSRKTLLDLTTRNRLLNIPQQSKSSRVIHVHDERTAAVWNILVNEKKDMSFVPAPEPPAAAGAGAQAGEARAEDADVDVALPEPEEDAPDDEAAARHSDKRLQTRLVAEKLQRRLLDMFYDARTFIEEQGVNILYLALGQLRWYEAPNSELERTAPLILLPVKLERRSAAERFYLSWNEEDAQENLSLAAKLKAEFGIVLPEFRLSDEFDPTEYLSAVAEAVKGQPRWAVLPNAITLGFFSFAKFLMYRDLDPEVWPENARIDTNGFICALLRDGFPAADSPIPDASDYDFDAAIPVARQTHVVDADAYQALAIDAVRNGRNLVLQGPPGTGKSQTITNLIAAAVADGKTVLFVAEKLAALEVVKRRLDREGLGDIALELHSNKTQKRAVLQSLKQVLDRGRLRAPDGEDLLPRLEALRRQLNGHAAAMNDTIGPSGLSPQQILGHVVRLGPDVASYGTIPLEGAEEWTLADRDRRRAALEDLAGRIARHGGPRVHPWRGVRRQGILRIDVDRLLVRLDEAAEAVADMRARGRVLAERLARPVPESFAAVGQIAALAAALAEAPPAEPAAYASPHWDTDFATLRDLVAEGLRMRAAFDVLGDRVADAAWATDFSAVRMEVAMHGQSLFRVFNGAFRRALATAKAAFAGGFPRRHEERVRLLDAVVTVQTVRRKLAAAAGAGGSAWGALWAEEKTDWTAAGRLVAWIESTQRLDAGEPPRFVAARVAQREGLAAAADELHTACRRAHERLGAIVQDLDLDLAAAFGAKAGTPEAVDLPYWSERLDAWRAQPDRLSEWSAYTAQADVLRGLGLGSLVEGLAAEAIAPDRALAAFDAAYFETLFRAAMQRHPTLARFDGESHERLIAEFRKLDMRRMAFARVESLRAHAQGLPAPVGVGAVGVLRGEMEKKRNHLPLRRLFKAAGPAIQAIKPVFMMSPLSVAQYLEPGAMHFDLLLIDEASQIEPVDAFGAIARAEQLVVVGDDKQLPPSRFFMRLASETAESEEEDLAAASDVESILGLCAARGLPRTMLRWHYRSRHQSLIAVSNRRFYDSKLFIVPSPHREGGELGLKIHFVHDGVFDRGGTAQNRQEARAVAEAVVRHARSAKDLSLGVAAFSLKQAQAIRDEIELLRRKHKDTEDFFAAHPHEPFFVKNLENVQGDERDVIFLSVGYGKDASGYMSMSFGPLNAEGGERRLNVLISRAKRRCEVFSSIRADDIDLARARGEGVAALKAFLNFAETGRLARADAGGGETQSPFEDAVKAALERHGLDVRTQVGIAGFFIDLAVVDPDRPGRYLLGIECDGAAYHSCRAARDRDRLRQQVLEDHGWRLHRIWSTDWFNRPDQELQKVLNAIEIAKAERQPEPPAETRAPDFEIEFVIPGGDSPLAGVGTGDAAPRYREASFDVPKNSEPHEISTAAMAGIVARIIEMEGPIHEAEIVARVRDLWGLGRAGSRIQKAVGAALRVLAARDAHAVHEKCWRLRTAVVIARDRSDVTSASLRKPDLLPAEELRAAILDIVRASAGATRAELPQAVARRLGFAATSAALRQRIDEQVPTLLGAMLAERGGLLVVEDGTAERTPPTAGTAVR